MGRVSAVVVEGWVRGGSEWWEDDRSGNVEEWREGLRGRLATVAREGRSGSVARFTRPSGGK